MAMEFLPGTPEQARKGPLLIKRVDLNTDYQFRFINGDFALLDESRTFPVWHCTWNPEIVPVNTDYLLPGSAFQVRIPAASINFMALSALMRMRFELHPETGIVRVVLVSEHIRMVLK